MKIANLETFAVLARLRHFGRTAERLNITQPAISSRIAALERELGARLVARGTRQVHLTPAGLEALRVIETMLGDFEALKLGLSDAGHVTGLLRVGAIDAVVQTWFTRLYDQFRHHYPRARIEIIVDSTVNLIAAMRAGDLDLTVCLDPVLEEGYRSFVICTYAMSWIGSPKLADADRVYSVAELAAMPLITFQRNSPPYRMVAPYFLDESVLASQLSNSNSLPTMIRLATDGFGIAAVPSIVVQRDIAAGALIGLKVEKPFPPLDLVASYPSGAGSGSTLIAQTAELARRCVREFCVGVDPRLAWT